MAEDDWQHYIQATDADHRHHNNIRRVGGRKEGDVGREYDTRCLLSFPIMHN